MHSVLSWSVYSIAACADSDLVSLPQPVLSLDLSALQQSLACLIYTRLFCLWTCLFYMWMYCLQSYSNSVLPVDVAVLQQPVLPLEVYRIAAVLPMDVSVFLKTVMPLNVSILQYIALCCSRLCCLWTYLFYSSLCCLWTYDYFIAACAASGRACSLCSL
jgi:hypothetical protein